MTTKYEPIAKEYAPTHGRWDTPGQNQGQIIEIQYWTAGAYEAAEGAPYRCVVDHSRGGAEEYFRLVT